MNICVDFDDTLNFESFDYTKDYMPNHVVLEFLKGKEFYIVTARDDNKPNRSYINGFCERFREEFNLKPIDIYYTNRTLKGDLLVDLECDLFIDDNLQQLNDARANGINSVHPDDLLTIKVAKKKDPKTGTGKKPKGSGRRLYTDENPKDTCKVSFTSASAIRETFSSSCFKSKPHARQSQIINLVHQRVRAAYKNAKDPKTKARLKRALNYAEKRKEQSKKKTERLRKKKASFPFIERNYSDFKIRKFSFDVDPEELVWHRDREDRYVEVLDGEGWSIQYDNEIPMTLELGDSFFIKKNSWHRVIKGNSDLIIKISEKPYHYRFENELGNEILVGVEETYDENKGVSFNAVKIIMEGPDSISENTITYKEAEELRGVLTDFLEDYGIMESTLEQSNDARDYNKPTKDHKSRWSAKYKKSINCSNPKGFSQKQYCKRKKRGGKYKS